MKDLLLLGTYHLDPDGERKIQTALEAFQPTHVFVEGHPGIVEAINSADKEFLAAIKAILKGSVLPSLINLIMQERHSLIRDITAAEDHCRRNPEVPLIYFRDVGDEAPGTMGTAARAGGQKYLDWLRSNAIDKQRKLLQARQRKLVDQHAQIKETWANYGNTRNERVMGDALRAGPGRYESIRKRDEHMWRVLSDETEPLPSVRAACIIGGAHVMETTQRTSLLDRVRSDGSFTIQRQMLGLI